MYLDGNSLGALPRATPPRLAQVAREEWGRGLVASWNAAGWIDFAQHVGDKIGRLVGAGPGEVTVADSTSVSLYQALWAALDLVDDRDRTVIVTEAGNFPTDRYVIAGVARARGCTVRAVAADRLADALGRDTALVALTHVDYRTGAVHDMAAFDRRAHAAGALVVWDLSHSAGAVPLALHGSRAEEAADLAVGCGYKYFNGGPGAPAYLWVHPRHTARMDAEGSAPAIPGWMGHAAPFAFADDYMPAPGIARFRCGTPPILSLAALDCGVETLLAAGPLGGVDALHAKSMALTALFLARIEAAGVPLTLASPRTPAARGSQLSFTHADGAYPIVRALIARGVVGDFRAPDVLRFGFAPLYVRYVDAWDGAEALADVVASGAWREPRFAVRATVT